ncbi:MAG: hypothetical protein D6704_08375 [Nitrospirae bacterium]|nr:MAG: hypothetical protein D6704_08375 [Nitrospirota bacterium]
MLNEHWQSVMGFSTLILLLCWPVSVSGEPLEFSRPPLIVDGIDSKMAGPFPFEHRLLEHQELLVYVGGPCEAAQAAQIVSFDGSRRLAGDSTDKLGSNSRQPGGCGTRSLRSAAIEKFGCCNRRGIGVSMRSFAFGTIGTVPNAFTTFDSNAAQYLTAEFPAAPVLEELDRVPPSLHVAGPFSELEPYARRIDKKALTFYDEDMLRNTPLPTNPDHRLVIENMLAYFVPKNRPTPRNPDWVDLLALLLLVLLPEGRRLKRTWRSLWHDHS